MNPSYELQATPDAFASPKMHMSGPQRGSSADSAFAAGLCEVNMHQEQC